jgi:hypothetical protein
MQTQCPQSKDEINQNVQPREGALLRHVVVVQLDENHPPDDGSLWGVVVMTVTTALAPADPTC